MVFGIALRRFVLRLNLFNAFFIALKVIEKSSGYS